MRKLFCLVLCLSLLAIGATAFAEMIHFSGNSTNDLVARNVTDKPIHLFITMEYMGCNGSKVRQPGAQYRLDEDKDLVRVNGKIHQFNPSFWQKISHYDHFYIQPGESVVVQNAPCFASPGSSAKYWKLGRAWHFTAEQWQWFKSNTFRFNPNCPWAK